LGAAQRRKVRAGGGRGRYQLAVAPEMDECGVDVTEPAQGVERDVAGVAD
jgi:hypothetical protein